MLRIAVVEDEEEAAATLLAYLDKYGNERGERFDITRFTDAKSLVVEYENNKNAAKFDIVFMDILLPYMNGMDAAKRLRAIDKTFLLIFVTNMANFAVKGYEVDALDFIIKPVVYKSFSMKMDKAVSAAKSKLADVVIPTAGGMKVLPAAAVKYVETSDHYLIYHTEEGEFRARGSLAAVEEELKNYNFARCNVCYLVNLSFIREVNGDTVTVGGDELKISRAKKKEFISWLTNKLGRNR